MKHRYVSEKLPISHQTDGHSCGILATNAVTHDALPGTTLVEEKDVDEERIALFVRVAHWDLESVITFENILRIQIVINY